MLLTRFLAFLAASIASTNAQGNNGQYTPWTTTTEAGIPESTTTTNYWTPTTTSEYWTTPYTTPYTTPPYTTPYAWTSYTTVTSYYTTNGLIITVTTWVPCPCDGYASTISSDNFVGTTTETLITTTTPAYSTFTSNGIVYVVPLSTPVTATASAGLEIVNGSDASKSTEIEGWVGVLSAVVLGGFAVIAVML